jgi:hypothetical protein
MSEFMIVLFPPILLEATLYRSINLCVYGNCVDLVDFEFTGGSH